MNIIYWIDNVLLFDFVVLIFWGDLFIIYISFEMNYLFDVELLVLERKEYFLMLVFV